MDTLNAVFDVWWIYDALVNKFGESCFPLFAPIWLRQVHVADLSTIEYTTWSKSCV